jgi:multidrug efflux system membrane fusion protein
MKQQGVLPEVQRTLNWVILASRFPVRIEIKERDPLHPLRMGMTAFVTILDYPADISEVSTHSEKDASKAQIPQ